MARHWHYEQDQEDIGWLVADNAAGSTNVLSREVLQQLDEELRTIVKDSPKGLVILSEKASGFMAGADVKEFRVAASPEDLERHIKSVHRMLQQLQDCQFPTVALLHGYCLGGGLELALACDYRIARQDKSGTLIGFPEIKLGLFPGYGGSMRSIRLLGPVAALQLMLTARSMSARTALKIGIIDQAVPERQLRATARHLVLTKPATRRPAWYLRILNLQPARTLIARVLRKKTATHARPDHYPAPFALIDHWQKNGANEQAMLSSEAVNVPRLLAGESSQNLLRTFFLQERLKSSVKGTDFAPRRVHVIGGGIMGGDIAAWCALQGMQVTLQDRTARQLSGAMQRANSLFQNKLRDPYLRQAAFDRLTGDPRGDGVRLADVVIEAIFEDIEAKQALYRKVELSLRDQALLATNTSSIPLERLGEGLANPERLVGLHFFNPVAKMQLIEVVAGEHTLADWRDKACAFAHAIGKLPLPVASRPGFLVNRVLMPYLLEAMDLLDEGVPAPIIDQAAVEFGMPMGPVALADTVGLDVCLSVAEKLRGHLAVAVDVPERLKKLVADKKLGRKTGQGIYTYNNNKAAAEKIPADYQAPQDITERLIFRLLNEAVACLREGIVTDEDMLDAGVIFGTGFAPFRGGPMHYIRSSGLQGMRNRLATLRQHHGEHFHEDDGWARLDGT